MAQESFEQLLSAVKQAESQNKRFDEKGNLTTSPKGAQGEMQVMPKTALKPGYGVAPAQDKSPDELARVGKDYLAAMLNKYGDREKALIAYNWGPRKTDEWLAGGADPKKLPAETQSYVQKINGMLSGTKSTATQSTEPTNSEKMMTDALKSGMSAKNLVQEAGPGYKAAMAMMFLADDKPKTEEDDIWKEAEPEVVAEEEAPSPLASLDLTYKSPFPAQNPAPVQRLADGGMPFTPTIGVKGTAREELDKIKADYDVYNTEVGKYNDIQNAYKTQVDAYNAAANAYNDSFLRNNGNMVVAQRVYNAKLKAYNNPTYYTADDKGTLTAYNPSSPISNPIFQDIAESPGYFLVRSSNVAAPGTAPTAPTAVAPTAPAVTQEQYQAKADAAKMDAKQRQTAVNVASDPESYGLTINRLFNQGGAVYRSDGSPEYGEIPTGGITDDTRAIFGRSISASDALRALKEVGTDVGRGAVSNAESLLRGSVSQVPGVFGDLEAFGRKGINFSFGPGGVKVSEKTVAPTSEEIRGMVPRATAARPESSGMESLGEVMAPGFGKAAAPVAKTVGKEAARQMLRGLGGEGPLAPISPPVMTIVRPSGGLFPTASVSKENGVWITDQPKSNLDLQWAPILDRIVDNTAELGQDKTDALMEMFGQKLKSYYSKQAGGPNDPLRTAVFSGKVKFDEASDLNDMFPKALIEAAKRKDITALRLLEKKYDDMLGVQGNFFQRETDQALRNDLGPQKTTQMIMEQMKNHPEVISDDMLLRYARKDFSDMNPQQMKAAADEIRAKLKENPERFSTVLEPNVARTVSPNTGNMVYEQHTRTYPEQYPLAYIQQESLPDLSVQMGIDRGEPLFDVKHPSAFGGGRPLLGLSPDDLVEAAKQMNPKDLSRMSFPEFVLRAHNDSLATQTILGRAPEIERALKAGNPMPKDLSEFGVKEFMPTANNYRWMEITQPQATQLQAKALGNSIAGYSRSGSYGSLSMGKAGMDTGAVRLFALYDPQGTPVTHVEYITDKVKTVKPDKADKANTITQFYGNGPLTGNVSPDKYVDQVEDLVNKLDVVDLPYSIKTLMRANGKFSTGGSVERVSGDNRRYL